MKQTIIIGDNYKNRVMCPLQRWQRGKNDYACHMGAGKALYTLGDIREAVFSKTNPYFQIQQKTIKKD